jgi:hypothetical protein
LVDVFNSKLGFETTFITSGVNLSYVFSQDEDDEPVLRPKRAGPGRRRGAAKRQAASKKFDLDDLDDPVSRFSLILFEKLLPYFVIRCELVI